MTMRKTPINVCNSCLIQDTTVCPLLEIAFNRGLEGMESCSMREAIFKVVEKEKGKLGWGPKNERRPKIENM